jgi:aryl-alcohol dehydrogenase-like predicted oxidoreductase
MRTRPLGGTGLQVTEVGYGGWGLGRDMWLGADDAEGKQALKEALSRGVRFFDTALVYGDGHSERMIGKVLGEARARGEAVVATKIPPRNMQWPGSGDRPLRETFPARHVVACVETSLRNLGDEALQLQQLHVWHDRWLEDPEWPETRSAMQRLKEEGKVLHWGISINDHAPQTALEALADPLLETAQVIYNIYDRSPERALFPLADRLNLGIIARVPLDEGGLTGAITRQTVFPVGDWREEYFAGGRKEEAERRAAALKELLGDEAATLPELALRFTLSRPEVSTVIPGMRRAKHVAANASVADGRRLSDALLARLAAHAWEKNWYE